MIRNSRERTLNTAAFKELSERHFRNIYHNRHEIFFIQVFFFTVFYKSALLKTRECHFSLVLVMEFRIISSYLGKVKYFSTILTCQIQLMFNVCMKTVNELYMFLTELNGWVFIYKLIGCKIDSLWSYLNFRYRAYLEQQALWHSGNYRGYIYFKTRMWHENKLSCFSTLFY